MSKATAGAVKAIFMLSLISGFAALAAAQNPLDEVHITPPVPAAKLTASTHADIIRKNVDLVLVPVTVTDDHERLITGLDQSNFKLFDGKQPQQIKHFSAEDMPVSVGIVLDLSASMANKIEWARRAILEFCKTANPADEFFMVGFSARPELLSDFTSSVDDIQGRLAYAVPNGRTALLDAVYFSVHQIEKAKYPKRALLIISDGGDNHSRYSEHEIRMLVKEADVMLYAIAITDVVPQAIEEIRGPELLAEISAGSGGRAFGIAQADLLPAIAAQVGVELRNQYVLGYSPDEVTRNGKWHKIQVKIKLPKSFWPVWVHAKSGYYAPAQ